MTFALAGALVAGILTTLAPCVLPLLPVIVGGTLAGSPDRRVLSRALIVTTSLGVSVFAFTLLLRASTVLIGLDPRTWSWLAGGLLILLGLVQIFPALWDRVSSGLRLQERSTSRLSSAREREGWLGAALIGAALGPVFSSCSPLYGYVVVTVIPAEPARGIALLTSYVIGMCATLLLIALGGGAVVRRLGWLADPHGWPRRLLGVLFVIVGVVVLLGWDRSLQTWIIENAAWRPWELDRGFIPE